LSQLEDSSTNSSKTNKKIRERKNSGALFTASGSKPQLSSITFGVGNGRAKKERKISLTTNQGKFLYFLPFPNTKHKTIISIMKEAGVDSIYLEEIADIVSILETNKIIEIE